MKLHDCENKIRAHAPSGLSSLSLFATRVINVIPGQSVSITGLYGALFLRLSILCCLHDLQHFPIVPFINKARPYRLPAALHLHAATTSTTIGSGRDRAPQRPRSATQSASLEVQTDSRPASQPSSSKPLSYFDKLVINSSSRAAGHLADRGEEW